MTNKIISSVMLTTCIAFFALANANPDNLLFLFVSANPIISLARIVLALGMVLLSFKNILHNPQVRQSVMYLGFSLIAFGALSMVITPLGSAEYNYAKLMDWMIFAEAGTLFAFSALTAPVQIKKQVSAKAKTAKLRSRAA